MVVSLKVKRKTGGIQFKECFEMKMTSQELAIFTNISGHFFAKYINIFQKTETLTVILKCPTYSNLNWAKSYDINHIFLLPVFCNFVRKKTENL